MKRAASVAVALVLLAGCTPETTKTSEVAASTVPSADLTATTTARVVTSVSTAPPVTVTQPAPTPTFSTLDTTEPPSDTPDPGPADEHTAFAEVDSVTDGDTIRVFIDGYSTPVRLLGIDTPETVNTNPDECYGAEASAKVHELLDGTAVILATDPTQGTGPDHTDKYGRWLRYVTTGDTGEDVSQFLLTYGYAKYVEFDGPLERSSAYREAETLAKMQHRGGWSECGW